MRLRPRLAPLVIAVALVAGCAGPGIGGSTGADGGVTADAGDTVDAGATHTDGGAALDGGATLDGGTRSDGGALPEGGIVFDGGAGTDGGALADGGGSFDGGASDGGVAVDGGDPSDGGATGVGAPCTASRDCTSGLVCGEFRDTGGGVLAGACTLPRATPPAKQVGETCSVDAECRESICLDTISGTCSVLCRDAAADCPANHTCTTYTVNTQPFGFCNPACARDADCASFGATACTINVNTITNQVDRVCQLATGPGAIGATCTDGSTCRSGICLTTTIVSGTSCTDDAQCAPGRCECPQGGTCAAADKRCITEDSRCTAVCAAAADCAVAGQPLTDCGPVQVSLSGGGTASVDLCVQP